MAPKPHSQFNDAATVKREDVPLSDLDAIAMPPPPVPSSQGILQQEVTALQTYLKV
jgi:hypothetical protein